MFVARTRFIRTEITVCPASFLLLPSAAAHPLEFEVSRCRTSWFTKCLLPAHTRVWNDLPYIVFDTVTLDEFKGAVNRWLLADLWFSVFRGSGACGVAKAFYKQFCFSHLGMCAGFNNTNNVKHK